MRFFSYFFSICHSFGALFFWYFFSKCHDFFSYFLIKCRHFFCYFLSRLGSADSQSGRKAPGLAERASELAERASEPAEKVPGRAERASRLGNAAPAPPQNPIRPQLSRARPRSGATEILGGCGGSFADRAGFHPVSAPVSHPPREMPRFQPTELARVLRTSLSFFNHTRAACLGVLQTH